MATKITKRERYESVIELVKLAEENGFEGFDLEGIAAFAQAEIDSLERKAVKAKERAADKKAEGDALVDVIKGVLTDEFQTLADIAAQIEGEDVTVGKVSYRLNAMFKAGEVEKGEVELVPEDGGKKRKVVAYRAI